MDYTTSVLLPTLLTILLSILNGVYHCYRSRHAGLVIERFQHSVFHKREKISYLIGAIILYGIAWQFGKVQLTFLTGWVVLAILAKIKMGQMITVSEQGILIRGKYEQWKNIKQVKILESGHVRVVCKRTSYEIEEMVSKETFEQLSKDYIVKEWFYADEE